MVVDNEPAVRRARRRVAQVRGFYAHVLVYLVVNALLTTIDLVAGSGTEETFVGLDWAYWPIILWGVIVVADGLITILVPVLFGEQWEERRLSRYAAAERKSR